MLLPVTEAGPVKRSVLPTDQPFLTFFWAPVFFSKHEHTENMK